MKRKGQGKSEHAADLRSREIDSALVPNAELELALSQALDIPLLALRVSMESLNKALNQEGDSAAILSGALEEVDRLERNVRELVDFASAPSPMPLRCTVSEILLSASGSLAPELRRRVIVAQDEQGLTLSVDGPLLARSLSRFLENALEAGAEQVLLIARQTRHETCFTVIDDAPLPLDAEWAVPAFHTTKRNHLGLGLALAERDVSLLDGTIEFSSGHRGDKFVTVTVPDTAAARRVA